jgi:hypothetical protein
LEPLEIRWSSWNSNGFGLFYPTATLEKTRERADVRHRHPRSPPGDEPGEIDANLALVAVAAMLGHAEGHPMNVSQIATRLRMPRTSALRRLNVLVDSGLLVRINGSYELDPHRARRVPHRDKFELILSRGFEVLGPHLTDLDT